MKALEEEGQDQYSRDNHGNRQNYNNQQEENHQSNRQNYNHNTENTTRQSSGRNDNYTQNNRWHHRQNNQCPPRENNQQLNQVTTENEEEQMIHSMNCIPANNQNESPYLQCELEGEKIHLLVDTGATISVLTKEVIDLILKRNNQTPVLPVRGVQISNSVGKKICNITRHILRMQYRNSENFC